MNLRDLFTKALDSYDQKVAEVADLQTKLVNYEKALKEKEAAQVETEKDLTDRLSKVVVGEEVEAAKLELARKNEELTAREVAVKQREVAMIKKENELFGIQTRQDTKETELRDREIAVTKREETYKEEIEAKVAQNVMKNLVATN